MFHKGCLFLAVAALLSFDALAISNSEEYTNCMKREASDKGTTKCYEKEIKYFEDMTKDNLKKIKAWDKYASLVNDKEYGIDKQQQAFQDFLDSYCQYYVQANQNTGYSKEYLDADCRIGYVQMFAGYLNGLITMGSSLCADEED